MANTDVSMTIGSNHAKIEKFALGATQKIATSGETTAYAVESLVRIVCDADSHIVVEASPTPAITDVFMPKDHVEYFRIPIGMKIGVAGGNMYATTLE